MDRRDPEIEREAMAAVEEALDRPSNERGDYLQSHGSISKRARSRAIELLAKKPVATGRLMTGGAALLDDEDEDPEDIGSYRVLRLIGRGGMGNVYLAERATDDFDFVVAIKLIKQRLTTREMVERFRRERQILADLNHPNIARLFDGGETEDGAPYFVMEYIDGEPVDQWLEGTDRPIESRIAVFEQICDAVEAAHQRLVIHRDLTPPNVLITDAGIVKLIDFGIARPDDGDAAQDGANSAYTPGFAAPEQRDGGEATTLSDIYALGKLLELLAGADAPRELIAIANKAASENTDRRYPSVSALTEDIENHRTSRPVSAMHGGPAYLFGKFVRRQRLVAIATLVVALAVLTALILVSLAYRQTELARAEAEANLADTRELASAMMFDVFDEVSNRPGNSEARLMLARNAQRHLEALASDPDASYEARLAAGRGFYRLATATGTLGAANAGDLSGGIALYERSASILEDLYEERQSDAVRLALARSHIGLARDKLLTFIDTQAAPAHAERARALLLEIASPSAEVIAEYTRAERYLANALACCNDDVVGGNRAIQHAISRIENAPADVRADIDVRRAYNDLVNMSAGFRIVMGSYADGVAPFRRALAAQRRLATETGLPVDHRLEATIATNLARTLLQLDRSEEAGRIIEPTYQRALRSYRADPEDNDLQRRLAITSIARGWVTAENGEREAATRDIEQGLRLARLSERSGGPGTGPTLNYAHRLQEASEAYWANGQMAQACNTMRRAASLYRGYAEHNDLPMTSLRYRIAPMEERLASCS
ncbi:serine/threonine-protein kinase [Parasphingopyxis sp.]|uniref:serine/threonine-protein kinase n=1 Tax=Parasphingopyxis sp. TaxID=1920299 RepID=UPI002620C3F7|nr:serine/threonine-protein kinase [Parasphingopyxis sp.]